VGGGNVETSSLSAVFDPGAIAKGAARIAEIDTSRIESRVKRKVSFGNPPKERSFGSHDDGSVGRPGSLVVHIPAISIEGVASPLMSS
jgi:hypothetical protein